MQGFPKLTKSHNHFSKILLTIADTKADCKGSNGKNCQGLEAKVNDTVAND